MTVKLLGAAFIVLGCGGFGLVITRSIRKETLCLREFITALEFMECELNYHLTPLPQLCRLVSSMISGPICRFFLYLAEELEQQTASGAERCIFLAMERCPDIPPGVCQRIVKLGHSFGVFDLEGQIKCIRAVNEENARIYENMSRNQSVKLRSYKTLALCAGAALVILFI